MTIHSYSAVSQKWIIEELPVLEFFLFLDNFTASIDKFTRPKMFFFHMFPITNHIILIIIITKDNRKFSSSQWSLSVIWTTLTNLFSFFLFSGVLGGP